MDWPLRDLPEGVKPGASTCRAQGPPSAWDGEQHCALLVSAGEDGAELGSSRVQEAEEPEIPWESVFLHRDAETSSSQFTHWPRDLVWGEVPALHIPESPSVLT